VREMLNTLYVQSPGMWLGLDHDTVVARTNNEPPQRVPLRRLEMIAVFGPINVSAPLIHRCAQDGIQISWLTAFGRFGGSLRGQTSGNVLLRVAQHRHYEDGVKHLEAARTIVAGKLLNCARFARHSARLALTDSARVKLQDNGAREDQARLLLREAGNLDELRGAEGSASRLHFEDVRLSLKGAVAFESRTRRPPLSPFNALLSFLYGLARSRVEHALDAVGLDPQVGFLHSLRPGRPALALDLLEEHRPVIDRLGVILMNKRQIKTSHFVVQEGGATSLDEEGRRRVLVRWSEAMEREVNHSVLKERIPYGLIFQVQATIFARYIRGDLSSYLPYAIEPD